MCHRDLSMTCMSVALTRSRVLLVYICTTGIYFTIFSDTTLSELLGTKLSTTVVSSQPDQFSDSPVDITEQISEQASKQATEPVSEQMPSQTSESTNNQSCEESADQADEPADKEHVDVVATGTIVAAES